MGWLTGWQYRDNIVLPTFTSEQTDLNYFVTVPLLAGMNSDFSDVRFTDDDGATLLKQHIVEDNTTESTWIIKVPTSPAAGKTIHIYFGNAGASILNDTDVCPFYDDFSGDLSKWDFNPAPDYVAIESGVCVMNASYTYMNPTLGKTGLTTENTGIRFKLKSKILPRSNNGDRLLATYIKHSAGAIKSCYRFYASTWEWVSQEYLTGFHTQAATALVSDTYSEFEIKLLASDHRKFYMDDICGWDRQEGIFGSEVPDSIRFLINTDFTSTGDTKMYLKYVYFYSLATDGTEYDTLTLSGTITTGKINREILVALEQTASVWGTAVAPGALDEIKVLELSPLIDKRELLIEKTAGLFYPKLGELGRKKASPEIKALARYSGRIWSLAAQLMGLDTVSGSGPYVHTLTLEDVVDGSDKFSSLFACLGISTVGHRFEWPSVKPASIVLSGPNTDGYIELGIKLIANKMNLNSDCTAILSDFEAVTHMELNSIVAPIIPFSNGLFRINTESGSALASTDALRIRAFNFEFSRPIEHEFDSQGSVYYEWQSSEPIDNGMMDSKLEIEVGDLDSSSFLDAFQDETKKKADLLFALDANYNIKIEWPSLLISDMEPGIRGHDRLIHTITLIPFQALSNPDGMAFDKWRMTITDNNSAAYE